MSSVLLPSRRRWLRGAAACAVLPAIGVKNVFAADADTADNAAAAQAASNETGITAQLARYGMRARVASTTGGSSGTASNATASGRRLSEARQIISR